MPEKEERPNLVLVAGGVDIKVWAKAQLDMKVFVAVQACVESQVSYFVNTVAM